MTKPLPRGVRSGCSPSSGCCFRSRHYHTQSPTHTRRLMHVFFTNQLSNNARQLASTPHISLSENRPLPPSPSGVIRCNICLVVCGRVVSTRVGIVILICCLLMSPSLLVCMRMPFITHSLGLSNCVHVCVCRCIRKKFCC